MAKDASKPARVRYLVKARGFINGDLVEPREDGRPVYVWAAPGLAGKAFELAPETAPDPASSKPAA